MQKVDFSNFFCRVHTTVWIQTFFAGCTLLFGFKLVLQGAHYCLDNSVTESQSALTFFKKNLFQVYIITNVPCCRCDFAMSSGKRDSQNLGFPYLHCYAPGCCNTSARAEQNLMKIAPEGKIAPTQTTFNTS